MVEFDDETRRIMRALAKTPTIHVRGLMYRTNIPQNPLYDRLRKIEKAKFIKERRVGKQRQFQLTRRGFAAIYKDGVAQSKEFIEFLKETPEGKKVLDRMDFYEYALARMSKMVGDLAMDLADAYEKAAETTQKSS